MLQNKPCFAHTCNGLPFPLWHRPHFTWRCGWCQEQCRLGICRQSTELTSWGWAKLERNCVLSLRRRKKAWRKAKVRNSAAFFTWVCATVQRDAQMTMTQNDSPPKWMGNLENKFQDDQNLWCPNPKQIRVNFEILQMAPWHLVRLGRGVSLLGKLKKLSWWMWA